MPRSRAEKLLLKTISVASATDPAAIDHHLEELSELDLDELQAMMESESAMRRLARSLRPLATAPVRSPKFSEVVAAVPGRMTDEEYVKVLSGGTRRQWGPWRRLAQALMARRPLKR